MDRFTIVTSEFITPDSDVNFGGGTERTRELQALLDKAKDLGGLCLIVDGAYYTDTLTVHSHTSVKCVNESCGFFLKDNVTDALFQNAHRNASGERLDCDIHFTGGTYNFNCSRQEHHKKGTEGFSYLSMMTEYGNTGFRFFGVKNLTLKDVVFKDQRTYAMACGNAEHVTIENLRIELPHIMYAQNQDGLHFFGESRFITIKNISGCAGDDFIALTPDEMDGVSSITDVLIDGVFLDDSDQGIRLLTHGKGKLDRITVRNVSGTYKSYGFYINPWISPEYKEGERYGNFGSITFENIDLEQRGKKYDYTRPFLFRLGGRIDTLRIRGAHFTNGEDPSDFMQIGGNYIFFDDGEGDCVTEVKNLILSDIEVKGLADGSTRNIVIKKGEVENLILKGFLSGKEPVEICGGTVKNEFISGVLISGGKESER